MRTIGSHKFIFTERKIFIVCDKVDGSGAGVGIAMTPSAVPPWESRKMFTLRVAENGFIIRDVDTYPEREYVFPTFKLLVEHIAERFGVVGLSLTYIAERSIPVEKF